MGLTRNEVIELVSHEEKKCPVFFSMLNVLEKKELINTWFTILSQDDKAKIMYTNIPNGKTSIMKPFVYSQKFYSNGEPVPDVTKKEIEANINALKAMRGKYEQRGKINLQ